MTDYRQELLQEMREMRQENKADHAKVQESIEKWSALSIANSIDLKWLMSSHKWMFGVLAALIVGVVVVAIENYIAL